MLVSQLIFPFFSPELLFQLPDFVFQFSEAVSHRIRQILVIQVASDFLSVLYDDPARDADNGGAFRHIVQDDGACTDFRPSSDCNGSKHFGPC